MEAVLLRLEKIATRMEQISQASSTNDANGTDKFSVTQQYDECILQVSIPKFLNSLKSFSDCSELTHLGHLVTNVFKQLKTIIDQFGNFSKPSSYNEEQNCLREFGTLLKSDFDKIENIQSSMGREHAFFNHVSAISQSISAVCWFTCEEPVAYIQEMVRASEFYTNRILSRFKNEATHVQFVRSFIDLLNSLLEFVREHFPCGARWSCKSNVLPATEKTLRLALGDISLYDELNKGIEIAKDQLKSTHITTKSQTTEESGAIKKLIKSRSNKVVEDQNASIEFSGQRWTVENGHGQSDIRVDISEMKQTAYIVNCSRSIIKISGSKVNSITLDGCSKIDLLIECAVVSGLECVNCTSIRVQALNSLQTVTVDKTNGFHLFLSDASNCKLYSSISSEITMSIVDPETKEFKENAVPNQFVTSYKKGETLVVTGVAMNPCSET